MQAVSVSVRLRRRYTFTCVYRRPRAALPPTQAVLTSATRDRHHVVLGDFNAKHSLWTNGTANALGTFITRSPLVVYHPGTHTFRHANGNGTSTIDLLLTTDTHSVTACRALDYGPSDHRPVLYEFEGEIQAPKPGNYLFRRADWKGYKEDIALEIPNIRPLETSAEIDEAVATISGLIHGTAERRIPKFTPKPNHQRQPPKHVMTLIGQRNNLKNIYARTRDRSLCPTINAMTRQVAALMAQWKTGLWHEQLRRTHEDHKKFWRLTRGFARKRNNVFLHEGDDILSSAEQADKLAEHYASRDAERTASAPDPGPPPLEPPVDTPLYSTYRQLESALRRTKGNKSSGPDRIPYVLLKMLPRKGKAYLLNTFNASMKLGYFPRAWKHAVVVPLLKPRKSGDQAEHYRPISLLNHMSKIYEKLLLGHVHEVCRTNAVIPPQQTGFTAGLSCEHHIAQLQSHVAAEMNRNRATAFISLDCTEAFDCVSHRLLIHRLREYGFPKLLIAVLEEYLSGRTFAVALR